MVDLVIACFSGAYRNLGCYKLYPLLRSRVRRSIVFQFWRSSVRPSFVFWTTEA
jgi:hypothetical protein